MTKPNGHLDAREQDRETPPDAVRATLDHAAQLQRQASQMIQAGPPEGSAPLTSDLVLVRDRLTASVIRPLTAALSLLGADPLVSVPGSAAAGETGPRLSDEALADGVWRLARDVTRLRMESGVAQVGEAAAALQDLACRLSPDDNELAARLAELEEIQSGLPPTIEVSLDGPYLVTNLTRVTDWLGVTIPTRPQMALCRCGASALKPWCDGSHVRIGFTAARDPRRVEDRRDVYVGQQVTVLDNRGTCQHSGHCTDRLATVFHLGEEPFVTPSGGRMDEILRAVRDCPSGALSYAIDGQEARQQVDYAGQREAALEVTKDGPYRITGEITLLDGHGDDEPRNQGASREHYALCRCGHSQNKPFCSGMHWSVQFRDPVPDAADEPTVFGWCGGLPALTRMTRLFYEKYVPQDAMLGPIFANMSADHPQRVAKWLAEVFGGPAYYSQEYGGYPRMISEHVGKCLTEEWRARWVALMTQSSMEAGLPNDPEWRATFGSYLEWGSRLAVENSQTTSSPPQNMPMPRWDWHTASGPPGSRISALAPTRDENEQLVVLPANDEPVRFEKHVKPLFRSTDRQSMKFTFDLWAHADVKEHADAILHRLRNGSMPCDGPWPSEKIDVFARWVASDMLA